jgi:outer membrane protein assembly factor BamB
MTTTRRNFLRNAALFGIVSGLAGCLGENSSPEDATDRRTARSTRRTTSEPEPTEAPSTPLKTAQTTPTESTQTPPEDTTRTSQTDTEQTPAEYTPALSDDNESYRSGFSEGGAWSVPGYDAGRRGYNPNSTVPSGEVGAAWLRTPVQGKRSFGTTPPITDDSRVYLGSGPVEDSSGNGRGRFVVAFDGETGERAWLTTVASGRVRGIAHTGEMILAVGTNGATGSGALVALSAANGRERWRVDLPSGPFIGPVVLNGRAYVTTSEGGLTAVSLDGTRLWERRVGEGDEYVSTGPCVNASSVVVGTGRGRIVAYTPDDGQQRWRTTITEQGPRPRIQTLPTIADGTIYVTGTDYRLQALDAADGSKRWERRLLNRSDRNFFPSVAVVEETLYVNTIHGGLLALRRSDGQERWRTGEYGGDQRPAAAEGFIVVPEGRTSVQTYDGNGDSRWSFQMPLFDAPGKSKYAMNPEVAVAHDRVYISLNEGRLFSLGAG